MKRLWAVLALVAAAALLGLWSFGGSRSAAADEESAQVTRQDLLVGVQVTGTLDAVESVQLGPPQLPNQWDFKISFMAPEGTEIQQGQPVLGFDTSELENTLLEAMA